MSQKKPPAHSSQKVVFTPITDEDPAEIAARREAGLRWRQRKMLNGKTVDDAAGQIFMEFENIPFEDRPALVLDLFEHLDPEQQSDLLAKLVERAVGQAPQGALVNGSS